MQSSTASELQRRLDHLLAHLPAGVVVHGPDGRIRAVNRLARRLLGGSEAELIGRAADAQSWGFVGADKLAMPPSAFPVNIVLRTGEKVQDLIVGVPADVPGTLRWLICNAYPEHDADGHLIQVVVCFTDCTALKQAKQSLEKSEQRLRLVLQGSTDAPWDWDIATGEIYYSERWWSMLGYAPGEASTDPGFWIKIAHPDDRAALRACIDQLLTGTDQTYSIEFRLRHRSGRYVPVLSRGFVLRDARGAALRISGTNTDLTERKEAERRIFELAHFDQLTGLPNRRYVVDELAKILARCERTGQFGAAMVVDLDHFKRINDSMGHDAGDSLLQQVSLRLRGAACRSDLLGRLGADEFVIVLADLGHAVSHAVAEANRMVREVTEALQAPYHFSGRVFSIKSSIGVTMFDNTTAEVETVLKQADLAMLRAKSDRHEGVRFFDPGMQAQADNQAALARALHDQISIRQFVLYCQPQVSGNGRVVGAEVLVRWRRPGGELLGPNEFIGLAESCGLIVPLGRHVLEESCRALAKWRLDDGLRTLKLGVNVSIDQLRDPGFPDMVAGILARTGAPASNLCLEITESIFADDMVDLGARMRQLRNLGLQFSLDDFGTGYSSLAYLRRFPLAALKIDRSFVRDVHCDANAAPIVEAIVALARALHLEVVAEGVEYEAQRSFLTDLGCTALQGYLMGRPVPIEEFERSHGAARA